MAIGLVFALGVALVVGPWVAPAYGVPLSGPAQAIMTVLGALAILGSGIFFVFTKLYERTKASEAFVRTGQGGVKVIQDGGSIIVPFIHELVRVTLQTLKLEVSRRNEDALITEDKLRADIHAEFFVRVQPERESILQAARSLGERNGDPAAVRELVEDKLVSALRTAAAMKTLEQLNSERDEFLAEVMKIVADDLLNNGLILETVTISRLDQTDEKFLKDENIFDAQGRRKIAEITQQNLTERNRLVRLGERERKAQDVETQQQVLDLDRMEKEAAARMAAEVAKIEAETNREAQEKAIEANRQVHLAGIEKDKALQIAAQLQQQAVEVAEREKQEQIAQAERLRAAAEQALAEAEADRETARQRIETVKVTETAERERRRQVIEAQAEAERRYVAEQRKADADAYTLQKQAEAQQLAASAEADAIRKKAEAEAEAERQRAEGLRAKEMVPVDVEKAKVAVQREHVETVVKPELEAREKHGKVAQDFEIAKLTVAAEKEVRIALAEASATLFQKMEAKLYGTPEDVTRILEAVVSGQSAANTVKGFMESADERTLGLVDNLGQLASAAAKRLEPGTPEQGAEALESVAVDEEEPEAPAA